jgi:16S rRNA (guanine527-N7)-methyltransferase
VKRQVDSLLEALAAEPEPHTAVADPALARDVHVADSLTGLAVPELAAAGRIADIGAGAGFPGLVLAIALPRAQVDLIESQRRKCALIARLADAAGLANARAIPERAETWAAGEGREAYDAVTARALAALPVLVEYAAPLLREGGVLVAWKGARNAEEEAAGERAAAVAGMERGPILQVHPYPASRDHHLHVYRKAGPTPPRLPRRPGMAAKRPLG